MSGALKKKGRRDEDRLDLLFHALSDRTRRAIVARLASGPASVSELAAPFAMTLPAVSKHIRVLERGGLVSRKRSGGVQRCALTGGSFETASDWLEAHRSLWESALDGLARHAEKRGGES